MLGLRLTLVLLVACCFKGGDAANATGSVFFFCGTASSRVVWMHWNDLASGNLISKVATPAKIPFRNSQLATINAAKQTYHYFWNDQNNSVAIFSYSFSSNPQRLISSCQFSLPDYTWNIQCATTTQSGDTFLMATSFIQKDYDIKIWSIDPLTCDLKTVVADIKVLTHLVFSSPSAPSSRIRSPCFHCLILC